MSAMVCGTVALALAWVASVQGYRRKADDRLEHHGNQSLLALEASETYRDVDPHPPIYMEIYKSYRLMGKQYAWKDSKMGESCFDEVKRHSTCKESDRIYFFNCATHDADDMLVRDEERSFPTPSECGDVAKDDVSKEDLLYGCCGGSSNELHECCKVTTYGLAYFVGFVGGPLALILVCCCCLCCVCGRC
eukprot:TRINITY_DN22947_c0_g1_i1.p1 TRINITY_DN22947_c0_g1~~TRINITY_DN22947_c0_g1_i1.p1  ORF type:complete len:191 (-),score=19.98 TRINITY_DN22947_c0_g1_i1:72-644(-)